MVTKFFKITFLFLLMTTLTGCPGGEEDCYDYGRITRVDDLITITPLQTTYNQGDVITFKATIPSTNTYFGEELNLFEKTNDLQARLVTSYSGLFSGNNLIFVSGSQSNYPNWFNVIYDPNTDNYKLEINIILNKTGDYTLHTDDSFEFQGSTKCNRYRLDTNILHNTSGPGTITFTVQ